MNSRTYWKEREQEQLKHYITEEVEYRRHISDIYDYMMDQIQKEINGFYIRYAKKEGITLAEAKKRVSQLDIEAYERKAEKYVKNKTFTDEANEEMRLYNATMKINRLELLKANIGLELVDGFDELQKYYDEILTSRTLSEFERQAGILGKSIQNNAAAAHAIVNASFHNAKYSDRIWMYQDMLKTELDTLLRQGLIQGKNPRVLARHLTKLFGVSKDNAERLMVTELARVQTDSQFQSMATNGYTQYEYIACGMSDVCAECKALDGKVFNIADAEIGKNAPPLHPRCHCSVAAHMDREEFDKWLEEQSNSNVEEKNMSGGKAENSLKSEGNKNIIKLPRFEEAVIPNEKFLQYALNPEKSPDKAQAFEEALGYTLENADDLIEQIRENLPKFNAKEKGDNGYGMRYEVIMRLKGPNGKEANVLTAWIDDKTNGEMRLTSAYIDKE